MLRNAGFQQKEVRILKIQLIFMFVKDKGSVFENKTFFGFFLKGGWEVKEKFLKHGHGRIVEDFFLSKKKVNAPLPSVGHAVLPKSFVVLEQPVVVAAVF